MLQRKYRGTKPCRSNINLINKTLTRRTRREVVSRAENATERLERKGASGLDPERGADEIEARRNSLRVLKLKVFPEEPCACSQSQSRIIKRRTNPDNYQQSNLE